ncbi:MAG TPA: hypothetical protein VL199_19965 [Burkholderiales bacterium]|jgi:hypothetical protein|nr:hypothetical protein [Burkholderiales bacterium]
MSALFRLLSAEEYAELNLEQKFVYLHALAADLKEQLEVTSPTVEARENPVPLVRR